MKVLIIEDEPHAAQRLETLIKNIEPGVVVLSYLDSVRSAVDWLNSQPAPDLIFMDIQLADGKSFRIFDECVVKAPVIFTTAYDEYALKAFKVNSIDYILKPIDEDELRAAIAKFRSLSRDPNSPDRLLESISQAMQMLTKKYKERFVIKVGEHLRSIETGEVLFFISLEKATFAQTRDGRKHLLDFTLDQLETIVDPAFFFRINRKYLVSAEAIHDMISHTNSRLKLALKTSEDKDVIVAREKVGLFRDWLDR